MSKEVKFFLVGFAVGLVPLVVPVAWYMTAGWYKQRKALKETRVEINLLETLVNIRRKK